ncbi:hypothetical protein [Streptomyces macrosporus]|uniref:Uncharacterized protein n=1 Tax=Streptomyces macrosporus TaxID=44032 RepID=A0ABN3JLT5_9ACTN
MAHSPPPLPTTADRPGLPRRPAGPAGSSQATWQDACPLREWGCAAALRRPSWRLLSGHTTSDGEVEYCRCTCGALVVLCGGDLAAFTGSPVG